MFSLELHSSDVHSALGRLLDQARVAGLRLSAVNAQVAAGECRISATIDIDDRDAVERFARRVGTLFCIDTVEVRSLCELAMPGAMP